LIPVSAGLFFDKVINDEIKDSFLFINLIIVKIFIIIYFSTIIYFIVDTLNESSRALGKYFYLNSSSLSQIFLMPNLYSDIMDVQNRIFLTDVWTDAPIPAISGNYIVLHRPWNPGPNPLRSQNISKVLNGEMPIRNLCDLGITDILKNDTRVPDIIEKEFKIYSWLRDDFVVNYKVLDYLEKVLLSKKLTVFSGHS